MENFLLTPAIIVGILSFLGVVFSTAYNNFTSYNLKKRGYEREFLKETFEVLKEASNELNKMKVYANENIGLVIKQILDNNNKAEEIYNMTLPYFRSDIIKPIKEGYRKLAREMAQIQEKMNSGEQMSSDDKKQISSLGAKATKLRFDFREVVQRELEEIAKKLRYEN